MPKERDFGNSHLPAGMDMAIFEAKTAAVELLRHCRFEAVPGQHVTYGDKITLDIRSNGKDEFLVHVRDWEASPEHQLHH